MAERFIPVMKRSRGEALAQSVKHEIIFSVIQYDESELDFRGLSHGELLLTCR